ncbi:MAG: phage holin family protein [Coriobacteriales bacterium]|nr:phage holin family protein [Coriobacteriales bacterium]
MALALVPGVRIWGVNPLWGDSPTVSIALLAGALALLNAFLKPILQTISLPITCLTLGIFALIINTAMLYLAAWLSNLLGAGVLIESFWSALLASIIISVVSAVLNALTGVNDPQGRA